MEGCVRWGMRSRRCNTACDLSRLCYASDPERGIHTSRTSSTTTSFFSRPISSVSNASARPSHSSTIRTNSSASSSGADDGAVYSLASTPAPARLAVFWDSTLARWLTERAHDRAPSAVVFALDHVPADVGPVDGAGTGSLRRYLDAGGKVVWTGFPPWSLVRDSAGRPTRIDHDRHRRVLDVDLSGGLTGDYGAVPTAAGRAWALSGLRLSAQAMAAGPGVEVLATDELGRAAAAVRSYGGGPGIGCVALWGRGAWWAALAEIRAAAEHGVVR